MFFGGTFADGVVAALVAVLICFIQQKATKLFANTIMFNLFCIFCCGNRDLPDGQSPAGFEYGQDHDRGYHASDPGNSGDKLHQRHADGRYDLRTDATDREYSVGGSPCLWIYGSDLDGESMKDVILQLVMAFVGSLGFAMLFRLRTVVVDIGISGRCYLLGRISSGNVFQRRTDLYFRTGGFGTVSSLC